MFLCNAMDFFYFFIGLIHTSVCTSDSYVQTWVCLLQAVLAVIVLVNLKGMFKQYSDIVTLWKRSKIDLVRNRIRNLKNNFKSPTATEFALV